MCESRVVITFMNKNISNKNWYVVTNNTSWSDVEKAIHSGPYTTMNEAYAKCVDTSMWPELLTAEEAQAITY